MYENTYLCTRPAMYVRGGHNSTDFAIHRLTVCYNVLKLCSKRFLSWVPNSGCAKPVKPVYIDGC